jgi:hypothetical protein
MSGIYIIDINDPPGIVCACKKNPPRYPEYRMAQIAD